MTTTSDPVTTPILTNAQIERLAGLAMHRILSKGSNDWHTRQEVKSDVMYGIALALNRVDRERPIWEIEAYILRFAEGQALAGFTKRKPGTRRVRQSVSSFDALIEDLDDYGLARLTRYCTPNDWVRHADDRLTCQHALSLMDARERKVCMAAYAYGFTFAEVGTSIGLTESGARHIARTACARVRRQLLHAPAAMIAS